MKPTVLYIFLFTNIIIAQNNIEVKYQVDYSGANYDAYLVFNAQEYYFEVLDGTFESRAENEITKQNDEERHIRMKTKHQILLRLYYHNKDTAYLINTPNSEEELKGINTYDDLPQIEWKIIPDETKTILGYVCQRAEAEFRGSFIVAYFTPKIPSKFGPEKFGNLPGLILEVYDATPGYTNSYRAYEIDFKSTKELIRFTKNDTYINYKDFVRKRDELVNQKMNEIARKQRASLPRDIELKREFDLKRVGFEKVYEWEENK